jgi:penicillin amidase
MGKMKILDRIFSLNRGPFPVGGSFHTVNPMAYNFHRPFEVNHGASQRHIYNLSDWSLSQIVIPTGTSGIPSSAYYASQHTDFLDGNYSTDIWSKTADEETVMKYKAVFRPYKK